MTVRVYATTGSPYLRAVLMGLEEKGVPYEHVQLQIGQSRSEEHRARHPFGRIPAFEQDDFTLYETQAILRYVDRAFEGPALQPTDVRALARMDQIIGIVDAYVFRQVTATIGFQRFIAPLLGRETDEAACAAATPDAENCVRVLGAFLGHHAFLAADEPTLADCMLTPHIDYLAQTPEGGPVLAGTRLSAWLERIRQRPSFQRTTWEALKATA
jgi:glutathione S-transferase